MCIIAIKPKGKPMFQADTIRVMFSHNPDGAGLMFYDAEQKQVRIEKGFMNAAELLDYLNQFDFTSTVVILHFRIGTSGYRDANNCHPFPIYGENTISGFTDLAMAHNGILKNYLPPKGAPYNDTRYFIMKRVRRLEKGFIHHERTLKKIAKEIDSNKLVFLDKNGTLAMVGEFIEDDGYYFSNNSYLPYKMKQNSVSYDFDWYDYYDMDYDTFQQTYYKKH